MVNIFETDEDIQNWTSIWSTTISPTFSERSRWTFVH